MLPRAALVLLAAVVLQLQARVNVNSSPRAATPAAALPQVHFVVYSDRDVLPALSRPPWVHVQAPFRGYGSKWVALKQHLEEQSRARLLALADVVVMSDGHDVLPNRMPLTRQHRLIASMLQAPSASGGHVVFSAEGSCCVAALGSTQTQFFHVANSSRHHRSCNSHASSCLSKDYLSNIRPWAERSEQKAPQRTAKPYRDVYLNAGVAVGTVASFLTLMHLADLREEEGSYASRQTLYNNLCHHAMARHPMPCRSHVSPVGLGAE